MTVVARLLVATSVFFVLLTGAFAATERVLHSFNGTSEGTTPLGGLVADGSGNLYGVTLSGGEQQGGTVFRLSSHHVLTNLHNFTGGPDGRWPQGPLVLDSAGNLYGTTAFGGTYGNGNVFKPVRGTNQWTLHVLHSFNGDKNRGTLPAPGLAIDSAGNIYGTTIYKSDNTGAGTVFELSPQTNGKWVYSILHTFDFNGVDGGSPQAGPIIDAAGNLYGTTRGGGAHGDGTVYELVKETTGWRERILHNFYSYYETDGEQPYGAVTLDSEGNVYGTTSYISFNEPVGCVFKLALASSGKYSEKILQCFYIAPLGAKLYGKVILDSAWNIYGTADGGASSYGLVFKLTPESDGSYTESALYNFLNGVDGGYPGTDLIFDAEGNLYGITEVGGTSKQGTVFEVSP